MKKGHIMLFIWMITLCCFLELVAERQTYLSVKKEKERTEESLVYAVNETVFALRKVMKEEEEVQRKIVEESFFRAFFIRMGIADREEEQKEMILHIPLIAFFTESGGYFWFTKNTDLHMKQEWSELVPYPVADERLLTIEDLKAYLEENISELLSEHNYIAEQYGVKYKFSVPMFLMDDRELPLPMVLVFFQGWPLKKNGETYYENCMDAGGYVRKKDLESGG